MSDLLAADFARLLRSQVFHGMLIFCVECLIFEAIVGYIQETFNQFYMYGLMNTNFILFGILLSLFVGLFIGTEYSDGTIRNKLVAGNSRAAVYFSNLITSIIAGFIMQIIFFVLPYIILSIAYANTDVLPSTLQYLPTSKDIVQRQLIGLYIIIAYTAIFVSITTLICSRSGATAAAMATAILIFAIGLTAHNFVSSYDPNEEEQETSESTSDYDAAAELQYRTYSRQNRQPSEQTIKIYQFLDEFLPSSQSLSITGEKNSKNFGRYVIYDLSISVAATALGIILYTRKDLK